MNTPLVSVVIPTYNRKKMAERLIRSVLRSTYKNVEIIVIDDASPDNTKEYLESKFSKNKLIKIYKNKKNLYTAGSRNAGQEKATGEFILFIDDDNVVDPNMIKILAEHLMKNPKVGEVGPINYSFSKKHLILLSRSTRSMLTTKTFHVRSLSGFGSKKYWETDDIPNAFMVIGKVVRGNNIKFRPKYGIMYEESDYAYRIRKLGYLVHFVRDAKTYHDIEDLSGKKVKDYLFHFMDDKRRPFVFARNRIIFHSLYSNKLQNFVILFFWIWVFAIYYSFRFLFYDGYGHFTFKNKLIAAINYFRGTFDGLGYVFLKTYKI